MQAKCDKMCAYAEQGCAINSVIQLIDYSRDKKQLQNLKIID